MPPDLRKRALVVQVELNGEGLPDLQLPGISQLVREAGTPFVHMYNRQEYVETGTGGTFSHPSLHRFEPTDPLEDDAAELGQWTIQISGANSAGNNGAFDIDSADEDGVNYANDNGVVEADSACSWEVRGEIDHVATMIDLGTIGSEHVYILTGAPYIVRAVRHLTKAKKLKQEWGDPARKAWLQAAGVQELNGKPVVPHVYAGDDRYAMGDDYEAVDPEQEPTP